MKFEVPVGEKWEKVQSVAGEFEVLIRRPTAAQRFRHLAIRLSGGEGRSAVDLEAEAQEYRIRAALVDWRGIDGADDKPLPFSYETLCAAMGAYADIFDAVAILTAQAFRRIDFAEPQPGGTGGN